jgi:hypothetical protein
MDVLLNKGEMMLGERILCGPWGPYNARVAFRNGEKAKKFYVPMKRRMRLSNAPWSILVSNCPNSAVLFWSMVS